MDVSGNIAKLSHHYSGESRGTMLEVPITIIKCYPDFLGASLVAQRLKRLPGMQETWVRSLGREDPLEKEMATHSSNSCLE